MFKFKHITAELNQKEGLEGAVLQSIFNFGRAHENDDIANGSKRGWWGNEFLSGVGCRDWTLERAKQTEETKSRAIHYTKQALEWLKIDIADKIEVFAYYEKERLIRRIIITLKDHTKWETEI